MGELELNGKIHRGVTLGINGLWIPGKVNGQLSANQWGRGVGWSQQDSRWG